MNHIRTATRGVLGLALVLTAVLAIDFTDADGKTARGSRIAEFDLGGLSPDQARAELAKLTKASGGPVQVRTDTGRASIDPADLGLTFDSEATLSRLLEQPRNPVRRAGALLGADHQVAPVVSVDRQEFDAELDEQRKALEKEAVDGGVHFDGRTPVADLPSSGMRIDRDAAVTRISEQWLDGGTIDLQLESFEPTVSADTVRATVAGPAKAVTASPLTLHTRGHAITVSPADLGAMVSFVPDGKGGLRPEITKRALKRTLGSRLAETESDPVNATFAFSGGRPTVVPSRNGARVNWDATATALAAASVGSGRVVDTVYAVRKPTLDTAAARKLGVREVVSEFTTGGFSGPSGENIRLVAQEVDGALVLPGKTFSLNGYTGPRGTAQGYVTSTIIDHGRAAKAVGGGISQFATTLYNASYFAGLEDVAHTEHAYYISRYPEAREATVFEGLIDLQFRNNTGYGIFIETAWSSSSITVRMWSTKKFDVESVTGERTLQTSPQQVDVPAGDDCLPSSGSPGFTASNTRIVRDARSGAEVSRHTRTVRYAPEPIVRCR